MTVRRALLQLLHLLPVMPALATLQAHAQGPAKSQPMVWLRVRNASAEGFEHVWQGLPGTSSDVDLGALQPGQTSRWHALPATLAHYRKTRIQLAERQLVHVTDTSFPQGRSTLPPGHYTYVYTLDGGVPQLTVVAEADGARQKQEHQKQ
jgi:hypothetical protein